jgi:RNA 2',3'-cyclic 3'-phosphodiesterase
MRLFVAVLPPAGALDELEAAVAPLRRDWPELRWTGPDRWHVTLAFLGEVAEDALTDLETRLGRAARRHACQELRIGGGGAFSSVAKARVLIARIQGGQAALAGLEALAASVAAGARRAGAAPPDEGRRYTPHLTLARTRQPADLRDLVQALADFTGSPWSATEIHLIRSHPGPKPRYELLASWPIGARDAGVTNEVPGQGS